MVGDRKRLIVGSNKVAAQMQAVGECKPISLEEIEEKGSFRLQSISFGGRESVQLSRHYVRWMLKLTIWQMARPKPHVFR